MGDIVRVDVSFITQQIVREGEGHFFFDDSLIIGIGNEKLIGNFEDFYIFAHSTGTFWPFDETNSGYLIEFSDGVMENVAIGAFVNGIDVVNSASTDFKLVMGTDTRFIYSFASSPGTISSSAVTQS